MACSLSQLILTCMYYIPTFQGINNFSTPENRLRTGRPLSLYNIFHEETKTVGCASCFTTGSPKEAHVLCSETMLTSLYIGYVHISPQCVHYVEVPLYTHVLVMRKLLSSFQWWVLEHPLYAWGYRLGYCTVHHSSSLHLT